MTNDYSHLKSSDIADVFDKAYAYRDAREALLTLPLPSLNSDHHKAMGIAAEVEIASRELLEAAAALPSKMDTHPEREHIVSRLQSLQEEAQEADDDGRC